MGKKSKNHGPSLSPQINAGVRERPSTVNISANALEKYLDNEHVSINLRFFQKSCECFSKWQSHELKKFSAAIEKIRGYNPDMLRSNASLCEIHKGAPASKRFSLPNDISPDQALHEIKVDPSNKLRIHGFFSGSVFFMIWLDREHACFPAK